MNVLLPQYEAGLSAVDLPPGHWMKSGNQVWVRDPNGHRCLLNPETGEGWEIAPDGKVTPSIHCQTTMGPDAAQDSDYYATEPTVCGWHVFAQLKGWGS